MTDRERAPGVEQADERGVERERVDPSEQSPGRTSEGYGGTSPASGLDPAEVARINEGAARSARDETGERAEDGGSGSEGEGEH